MKLPRLPENKQARIAVLTTAGVFAFIIIALLYVSQIETVETMPGQPAPVVEPEAPPAPPNADNSKTILELFSPSEAALDNQLSTTGINRQIEQALTVTYVLTKCLIISQDDYADTYQALLAYAQLSKLAPDQETADQKLREIATSANASYSLVYSRISCNDKQLQPLAVQLSNWTTEIFNRKQSGEANSPR